jgi:hypothetical protein
VRRKSSLEKAQNAPRRFWLGRPDLTVLERSEHVAEWVTLTEEKDLKPSQVETVSAK